MSRKTIALALVAAAGFASTPAYASGADAEGASQPAERDAALGDQAQQPERQGPPSGAGGPPAGVLNGENVFDETWVTIGIGAGLVPSYSGSDDYNVFPLPLIVGRVGGVGISPNGPGFALDLLSQAQSAGPSETSVSFGPAFRLRNDRDGDIEDPVVALTEDLDTAFELGVQGGVRIPGVLNRFDAVTFSTQVRWDILGAHDGMLIEPSVGYFTPVGRGAVVQVSASASFVDDSFADYYYTVTPQQSADSGLAEFTADGGLNSLGLTAIVTFDLDGNALNGGLNIYGIGGYSRLVGDAADTPFTSVRGSADQFLVGVGVGYTF